MKIVWSDLAIEDLKAIFDYICIESRLYAERYTNRIIERVNQLENFPQSGRIVPEFSDENIRELIEGNHRVVYRIKKNKIEIVRIYHGAMLLKQ